MSISITLKFIGYDCVVEFAKYGNGRTALRLVTNNEAREPVAVATVNLPHVPLGADEVFIKNWSENEGIKEALVVAGVIQDTGETVPTGYVEANVCKLLVQPERPS